MTINAPVLDTWVTDSLGSVDKLNANIRDPQLFLAYAPLAIVQRSATQAIANNVQTAINWDTEIIDIDGMSNAGIAPANNVYVRRPGVYAIQLQAHFAANTSGVMRVAHIAVNGSYVASTNTAPAGVDTLLNCSAIVALNKDDIITGVEYQNSGVTLNSGSSTYAAPRMAIRIISTADVDVDYPSPADPTQPPTPVQPPPTPPPSPPPTSPTPTKHVTTFYSTWSRSYTSSGATRWDDSAHCYQGYGDSYNGNQRSLVGFNSSSIKSTLTGATNITATFNYKVLHTWYNAGGTIRIGSMNYTAKPSTWSASRVSVGLVQKSGCVAGKTYSVALPQGFTYSFASGSTTGIAIGPGSTTSYTYYAYLAGATESGRPSLTFTYWK